MWTLLGFITLYFSDRDTWTRDTWSEKPVLGVVSCHQLSAVQSMETSCYHAVLMQLLQQLCSDLQHHDNTLQHTHLHRNEFNRLLRRFFIFFSISMITLSSEGRWWVGEVSWRQLDWCCSPQTGNTGAAGHWSPRPSSALYFAWLLNTNPDNIRS